MDRLHFFRALSLASSCLVPSVSWAADLTRLQLATTAGTLAANQLPVPTTTTRRGALDLACSSTQVVTGTSDGAPQCAATMLPLAGGALSGLLTAGAGISSPTISLGTNFGPRAPLDIEGDATALGVIYPFIQTAVSEHQDNGYIAAAITASRQAGDTPTQTSGPLLREALHVEQLSSAGRVYNGANEQLVAVTSIAHITAGTGTAYGFNPCAWVDNGAATSAQAVGGEIDTDVRASSIAGKVGLQITDVGTSTGQGATISAGLVIAAGSGAKGYNVGLQFGYGNYATANQATTVSPGGTIIGSVPITESLLSFIDFSQITQAPTGCAVCLPAGSNIGFGGTAAKSGNGGSIYSETNSGGPRLVFGPGYLAVQNQAGTGIAAMVASIYQETLTTPASSSASCTAGQFTDDANYHYVCTTANTWKRVALTRF